MKKLLSLYIMLLCSFIGYAQLADYHVIGGIGSPNKGFKGGIVSVNPSIDMAFKIILEDNSKFDLRLDYGQDYVLSFSKKGYYTKKVLIELKNVNADSLDKKCKPRAMHVSMIVNQRTDMDSLFDKPIGRIFYDEEIKCFDWDADMSLKVIHQFEKLAALSKNSRKLANKADKIDEKLKSVIVNEQKNIYEPQLKNYQAKVDSLYQLMTLSLANKDAELKNQQTLLASAKRSLRLAQDSILSVNKTFAEEKNRMINAVENIETQSEFESNINALAVERLRAKTTKDSLAIDEKELALLKSNTALNNLIEREQAKKEAKELVAKNIERRNNLEYSGITMALFLLFGLVFIFGRFSLPTWAIELASFLPFLILFEFLLVLTDPYVESYASGDPMVKLLINACLAGLIFPLHGYFEKVLKQRLFKAG